MAEKRSEDFSEQLAGIAECPICTDRIQNNRLLPCGHTFCLKCLEQYKKSKAKGKSLPCPVCRREFGIPKGGCAMFPKNIMVEQLLAVENPSKDVNDVKQCDTCEIGNKTNASVHCIECEQSLCSECEKLHGKLKVSATHHVVPVSENNSQLKDVVRRSYCQDHSEYALEVMCYDCNKTICWKCRSLSHANHRVADMNDLADGYCEQLQSNIEEISSRLSVLSKVAGNISDQEKRYQENFDKEKANVSKKGAELIRTVVANEEKLIKELLSVLQKNLKSIQPHKEKVLSQMDSLKQLKASVEQLKESGNSQEIVDKTAELHSKAHQLLALSIISIDEPALSTMTESEIQQHLIGSNVTTANGTAGVRRVSSDSGRFCETVNAGSRLSGSIDPEGIESIQAITLQLNLAASSRSQTNAGTSLKGKPLPPATLKKPEQKRSPSLSLSNPDQDVTPMNVAKTDPGPGVYINLPSAAPSPPPQLPPRSNLPSTPSASDRTAQSPKLPEHQPSAKDVGLPVTTSTGFSVSSFSVGGGSAVQGVAVYKQKIYVATENNPEISVYSSDEHVFLHALVVPGLKQASDMTFCRRNSCLFLIDWVVRSIFRAEIEGAKEIIDWSTEGEFGGLSASADGSVILAGHETNSLKEYTTWGTLTTTVKLKSDVGEGIRPWHAVKLTSEKFVVSHGSSSDTALHRVCLVDSGGQIVKSFGGLRGRGNNSLWGPYHLCMTDENRLFIADCNNGRIVVLDENLEFLSEISGSLRKPRRICLDKPSNKLFVTDNRLIAKKAADGRIVIFSQVL